MSAALFEVAAIAAATRGLRSLPGKDALLLEIYADVGVTMQTAILNVHGTATVPQWSLSGSGVPFQLDARIASTAGGTALGQATYQISVNGGAYSTAAATAAGPTAIPGAPGWFLNMSSGTYNVDQTWQACVVSVANYAATNVTEPQVGPPLLLTAGNPNYIKNARAGTPGLQFDATGAVGGSVIQSGSCSVLTATPSHPYTAFYICRSAVGTNNVLWSMGGGGDGSQLSFNTTASGASFQGSRRSMATALQTQTLGTNDGGWHLHCASYSGASLDYYLDGSLLLGGISTLNTADVSSATLFQWGKNYTFTPGSSDLQAFACYSRQLSQYERAVVTRTLQKRFRFV